MDSVAFWSVVTPGPACVIPEDKKIFRVTAEDEPPAGFRSNEAGEAGEAAPLPVPHMYSA